MLHASSSFKHGIIAAATLLAAVISFPSKPVALAERLDYAPPNAPARPQLAVLLVVDQMRADYVEKFRGQWAGGLKRLVQEGAWFREAAYPYAATETCVGHATISTGTFPAIHGMVMNEWWDRDSQKEVACTQDPKAKNIGYANATVKGGNSAANMLIPAFSDELKFQSGSGTRIVTFSLKARAAITLAGRLGDAVTWYDPSTGAWVTSSAYPFAPFVENYVKAHPVSLDYGKTWTPLLPGSSYLYNPTAFKAVPPEGFGAAFPHTLHGKPNSTAADSLFYGQWEVSPYADTYLAKLADDAVDRLDLGKRGGTDFLGISFSSVDYVGHAFGPRSWEIQDILARLDRDLGELFAHLDEKVGRGNYIVVLTADHGVAPIPEDMLNAGMDAGWTMTEELKSSISKTLETLDYPKTALASVVGSNIYFAPGIYERLKSDPKAIGAVTDAIKKVRGVDRVYQAEQLDSDTVMQNAVQTEEANSFFKTRSGDLLVVFKPYWPSDDSAPGEPRSEGTTHGTLYYYDRHVPVLFMGFGIQPGEYFDAITPADIAPTLASLCGVTLASPDGHPLTALLVRSEPTHSATKSITAKTTKLPDR